MENIENPFVSYGRVIQGIKFLGRQSYIKSIENRLTKTFGNDKGNMALVGYPRIGKSSIAAQALLNIQKDLEENKKIPIWINVALHESRNDFFISLVRETYYYFEDNSLVINNLERAFERTQNQNQSWSSLIGNIQRFFSILKSNDYSIIFILDEFDYTRTLFKNDANAFQALRDLAIRNFGVYYITTSRRSIREIEIQSAAISTFDGVISKDYVSTYNQVEIEEYYQKFEKIGLILTDNQKQQMHFYCGTHPYLLAILGFEIIESYKSEEDIIIPKIMEKHFPDFMDYYEQLIELLKEDKTFNKLLQILFGPKIDVKSTDIDELLQYGLIQKNEKYYVAYSQHFQGYLKIKEHNEKIESDTWKLLYEVEKGIRRVIFKALFNKFGENWQEDYPKEYDNIPTKKTLLLNILQRLQDGMNRDTEQYGNMALNINILDQSYIEDLFANFILFSFDDIFKDIFGKDKNYWKEANKSISKVRNPYAHHKVEVLLDSEIKKAEEYCREIIEILNQHI